MVNTPNPKPGAGQTPTLADLRTEIDRIDRAMHELLIERSGIIDTLIAIGSGAAVRPVSNRSGPGAAMRESPLRGANAMLPRQFPLQSHQPRGACSRPPATKLPMWQSDFTDMPRVWPLELPKIPAGVQTRTPQPPSQGILSGLFSPVTMSQLRPLL